MSKREKYCIVSSPTSFHVTNFLYLFHNCQKCMRAYHISWSQSRQANMLSCMIGINSYAVSLSCHGNRVCSDIHTHSNLFFPSVFIHVSPLCPHLFHCSPPHLLDSSFPLPTALFRFFFLFFFLHCCSLLTFSLAFHPLSLQ